MEEVGRHYRAVLEIDDPHLSGENLVRGMTGVLFSGPGAGPGGMTRPFASLDPQPG